MYQSLFPEFLPLECKGSDISVRHLLDALAAVDLQIMAAVDGRGAVVRRLQQRGIGNLRDLLLCAREDVAAWPKVGKAFLIVFDEMRNDVAQRPEFWIDEWNFRWKSWTLPNEFPQLTYEATQSTEASPAKSTETAVYNDVQAQIAEAERVFVACIQLLSARRPQLATLLRRYFYDGLPAGIIAKQTGCSSSKQQRLIFAECFTPLLAGETVEGIQLSADYLACIDHLKSAILFAPASHLDGLQQIASLRFLEILGLTIMKQTCVETHWAVDLIVPTRTICSARSLLRKVLAQLQWVPQPTSAQQLAECVDAASATAIDQLLTNHPWIESHNGQHRLCSSQLHIGLCRIARLLYDSPEPLTHAQLLSRYEHCYLERPKRLDLQATQRRFAAVIKIEPDRWSWSVERHTPSSPNDGQFYLF